MSFPLRSLVYFVFPILALVSVGVSIASIIQNDWPMSIGVIGAALVAFAFCLSWNQSTPALSDGSLRSAIAAALVVQYIVLVGLGIFFKSGAKELPGITQSLLSSFTGIVGVVIAFYFGASAYVQVHRRSDRTETGQESESADPARK